MKKILITGIVFTSLLLTGCTRVASNPVEDDQFIVLENEASYNDGLIIDGELTNKELFGSTGALTETEFTIEEMIIYAIQDEFAAKAEYMYIIENFDVTKPFSNIILSEETHIVLLLPLFETYQIAVPADTSSDHLIVITSLEQAFAIGVLAEELNIAMYDLFLSQDDLPDDLVDVFTKLRDASYNHLDAFQKNLDRY